MSWTNANTTFYSCEGNDRKCENAVCQCDAEFLNELTVLLVDVLLGFSIDKIWHFFFRKEPDKRLVTRLWIRGSSTLSLITTKVNAFDHPLRKEER